MCIRDRYYRVLGVDATASPQQLKRAHRDLVQVWHPDRFTANPRLQKLAAAKLLEINHAYDALRSKAPEPKSAPPVTRPPRPARRSRRPRHRRCGFRFRRLGSQRVVCVIDLEQLRRGELLQPGIGREPVRMPDLHQVTVGALQLLRRRGRIDSEHTIIPVSYTHLTLPTSDL